MKNWKNALERILFAADKIIVRGVCGGIRGYQFLFSPDHGIASPSFGLSRCRFYPTCSDYAHQSISQYGLLKGSMASLKRLLRCGPWSDGGFDPPINNK